MVVELLHLHILNDHSEAGHGLLLQMTVPSGLHHGAMNMIVIGVEHQVELLNQHHCQVRLGMAHLI